MIKLTSAVFIAVLLSASAVFAEDDTACCAAGAANHDKQACANLASLHLTAAQESKIGSWQADCMKAGCTKESKAKFLKQAKGILSADQYAKLKTECDKSAAKKS
jgi:hypothetical protein